MKSGYGRGNEMKRYKYVVKYGKRENGKGNNFSNHVRYDWEREEQNR